MAISAERKLAILIPVRRAIARKKERYIGDAISHCRVEDPKAKAHLRKYIKQALNNHGTYVEWLRATHREVWLGTMFGTYHLGRLQWLDWMIDSILQAEREVTA